MAVASRQWDTGRINAQDPKSQPPLPHQTRHQQLGQQAEEVSGGSPKLLEVNLKGEGRLQNLRMGHKRCRGQGHKATHSSKALQRLSSVSAQDQLLKEATELLRGFRLAAVRVESMQGESHVETIIPEVSEIRDRSRKAPKGLLDGGATHPLRTARDGELIHAIPSEVMLACGKVSLYLTSSGTIVSRGA